MSNRDRDEEGNYSSTISDDELVTFVSTKRNCTSVDVAEEFGYTRQGADYRLRKLQDQGRIERETVGNTNVWVVVE